MNKPKQYLNKSVTQLLKYRAELRDDKTFCSQKADDLGFGAAAEFYRMRVVEVNKELERVDGELAHRGAIQ